MASEIQETDNGDGTKRVQQWDDTGELIYDMTVDSETVYRPMNAPNFNMLHAFPRTCCQLCGTWTGGGYCPACLDVVAPAADQEYLPARRDHDYHNTRAGRSLSGLRALVVVLAVYAGLAFAAVMVWKGLR